MLNMFVVVLLVTLQLFSKDLYILANLVHLRKQPVKVGPETAMKCVRHAIGGILCAGVACNVSRSPQGLERMVMTLVEVFRAFSLTVSGKKTKTTSLLMPYAPATAIAFTIPLLLFTGRRDYKKPEATSRE